MRVMLKRGEGPCELSGSDVFCSRCLITGKPVGQEGADRSGSQAGVLRFDSF